MRTLLSLLAIVLVLGLGSCKKDKTPAVNCSAWATEVQDELMVYVTAAQAFAADESAENCTAYKEAAQDFLDAMEPYGNCEELTGEDREDYEASIAEAQAEIEELNCDEL